MSAFAEREGLDKERLYRWQRRFARERKAEARAVTLPATPVIIELRPTTSPRRAEPEPVEIVLVSGVVARDAARAAPAARGGGCMPIRRGCARTRRRAARTARARVAPCEGGTPSHRSRARPRSPGRRSGYSRACSRWWVPLSSGGIR